MRSSPVGADRECGEFVSQASRFMGGFIRKFVVWVALPMACLFTLVVAGFLQEFASDDLPAAARDAGVAFPLKDPLVVVRIQPMTLALYDGETLAKRYNIGYGRGPIGRISERETSTPLGEFLIAGKEKRENVMGHGSRFLRFDFPTEEIAHRAWEAGTISDEECDAIIAAHAEGAEPPHDTPLGGPLGIQGNFFFFLERRFTDGSIALSNADINELYEHVEIGTRVIILDR